MPPNTLHENLANLAAQANAGLWGDEKRLRDQIMRLWRGATFEPPPRGEPLDLTSEQRANSPRLDPDASNDPENMVLARDVSGKCSQARRHGVVARKGETCPECGFTGTTTTTPEDDA